MTSLYLTQLHSQELIGKVCMVLVKIESKLVDLVLCMSNIARSLNLSEGLMWANDLINKTKHQKGNITEKDKKLCHKDEESFGTVSVSYWQTFLKHHYHILRAITVSGYSINQANFTNIKNLANCTLTFKKYSLCLVLLPSMMNQNGQTKKMIWLVMRPMALSSKLIWILLGLIWEY